MGLAICLGAADAQKKTTKKPSDVPAYDDYDDYDGAEDDFPAADGKPAEKASAGSSTTTTTAAPVEEDDSAKDSHPFFKNRFKLRARPSPHPAVKTKPTLPSFIKHPASKFNFPKRENGESRERERVGNEKDELGEGGTACRRLG